MSLSDDLNTKIPKLPTNLDRFDRFINGTDTEVVATDDDEIPSLAKIIKDTGIAGDSADRAEAAVELAIAVSGPTYASTAAGIAATTSGGMFAVNTGDNIIAVYLNNSGTAVLQRKLPTTALLASGLGAGLIGTGDGRTVQEALDDIPDAVTGVADQVNGYAVAATVDDADVVLLVQGGVGKKSTAGGIRSGVTPGHITGLSEMIDDRVGALFQSTSTVQVTYNDAANTITLDVIGGGGASTASAVSFAPTGGISATTVQAAIAELDSEKAPASHTHAVSQIPDFAEAVDDRVAALFQSTSTVAVTYNDSLNKITLDVIGGGGGASTASAVTFSATGNIASTDVQAAIAELDTEKTAVADLASTASGKGAALVGFKQAGTGAVAENVEDTLRRVVYAAQWNPAADSVTDDTAKVQAVLDAHPGKDIVFDGTMAISTLTVSGDNTRLIFRNGAGFTYSTATAKALTISGDNVIVEGLNLTGPATFDGTNVQPTYAAIWITGANCKVIGGKLTNVPKVGVMFADCNGGSVSGLTIEGNYPTGSFTGTQVGHMGILIDAADSGDQGNFIIHANHIAECVQGVLIANYGTASRSQGIVVTSNTFRDIWNHGVYGAGINYANVVSNNAFVRCQLPVALSGYNHVVSGNTITTGGSAGTYTDQVGISLRDPVGCVVANNTLTGEIGTGQIVINLMTSLGTIVRGNIVQGNTIDITGSGSATLIGVGGTNGTDLTDNIIQGNVCKGTGRTSVGLIVVNGAASCPAHGTVVDNNTTVAKSASHGVQIINLIGAVVSGNRHRLEFDLGSALQLCGVQFADCSNCDVHDNTTTVTASWGTNAQYIGIWETGTSSGNRAWNNPLRADPTKIVYGVPYSTVSGSGILVRDIGAGAPNLNAGVGSTWGRSDGGAGTALYVKEVGSDASGWVAK